MMNVAVVSDIGWKTGGGEGPMAALSERIRLLEEELLEMNEAGESAGCGIET